MSDELERKHPASDEGEGSEDFEAHRKHPMTDEGDDDDVEAHRHHLGADDDDVEAHRHHLGRQHGGA